MANTPIRRISCVRIFFLEYSFSTKFYDDCISGISYGKIERKTPLAPALLCFSEFYFRCTNSNKETSNGEITLFIVEKLRNKIRN